VYISSLYQTKALNIESFAGHGWLVPFLASSIPRKYDRTDDYLRGGTCSVLAFSKDKAIGVATHGRDPASY
jgi:hypothetical protein